MFLLVIEVDALHMCQYSVLLSMDLSCSSNYECAHVTVRCAPGVRVGSTESVLKINAVFYVAESTPVVSEYRIR